MVPDCLKLQCSSSDMAVYGAVRYVDRIQYFQKLIPGQNQNAEYQYRALEVGESTRYCYIQGYTLVNGVNTFVYAESNRITVKVVPQQG